MFGDESTTREILGHVPRWLAAVFYVLAAVSCAAAGIGFWRHLRGYRQANRIPALPPPWRERVRRAIRYLVFHEQLRRDPFAGWSHLLIVYGFFILFVGTCLVFLEHDTPLHFYYGWFYQAASLVIDLGGLAFLVGLSMFLGRRAFGRSRGSRRILRAWWVASLGILLFVIGLTGFLLEAARIAIDMPSHEWCSVVGYPIAVGLQSIGIEGSSAIHLQQWLWGTHAAVCIVFFALLPWGFFGHMTYGLASVAARRDRPLSQLSVATSAPEQPPGATTWNHFSRLDLLQADACSTCGRCNEVCPAASAGKPLRPRDVVLELRRSFNEHGQSNSPQPLHVADDVLWSCTTCGACNHACPVGIDVYDKIIDLRRGRIEAGHVPIAAENVFEATADRGNPFGRPNADRMLWAQGLHAPVAREDEQIDVLYWIGCSGSFSPEGQAIARSMVKILNHLGINYRVLGTAERCTGDPARRMGEEGLFQQCAAHNLSELKTHGVKRVITHCPHCYNTIRNEYPAVDGETPAWQTVHHTEFLAEQFAAGKLTAANDVATSVTFHDPCYLGRGNGVVAAPRQVLDGLSLPLVEMPRHGKESFCCGAGGGSMWLDVRGDDRIENQRYAEAAATGSSVVATACPFCKTMLAAARQSSSASTSGGPQVLDLAELVATAEGL